MTGTSVIQEAWIHRRVRGVRRVKKNWNSAPFSVTSAYSAVKTIIFRAVDHDLTVILKQWKCKSAGKMPAVLYAGKMPALLCLCKGSWSLRRKELTLRLCDFALKIFRADAKTQKIALLPFAAGTWCRTSAGRQCEFSCEDRSLSFLRGLIGESRRL